MKGSSIDSAERGFRLSANSQTMGRIPLDSCAHYRRLPSSLRPAFEQSVQRFIATQRITGVGVHVDDHLRLLVASSASTLSLAWPDYKWSRCRRSSLS